MFVHWLTNFRGVNLFDWTLKIKGYDIAFAKAELSRIQSIPEAAYPEYIEKQKKAIVAFHKQNNSLYKKLCANLSSDRWDDLPVLAKSDLQQPLNKRLSEGYSKKNIYVNKTSGSSGNPFIFAKDKASHALTWAVIQNRFGWYNIDFNSSKQARFYGIPLDTINYQKERLKDRLSHRYRFPIFDLSDSVLKTVLEKFSKTPFEYLNGYTSSIVLFAKYLKKQEVLLKEACPTLKACVVTSEMLFDVDKKLMEEQFGVPVINEFGASELDLIAFQNTDDEFQLNSETLFVEVLDENNKPLPHGQEGKLVITSLYNKAHPFIRYEIGDLGVISEKSTAKKPILEKLIGRTNDIAKLPSGKVVPGLTFYYVTKSIIEDSGDIKEFVIKQTAIDSFEIDYVGTVVLSRKREEEIQKALNIYLEPGLRIIFNKFDRLQRQKSGKLKQFISLTE